MDGQHSRIDPLERINDGVVPRVVVLRIDPERINGQPGDDEGFLVGVEIGVQENAIRPERGQGLEQSFGDGLEILATVNGEARRWVRAGIDIEDGANSFELVFMLLDVSARTVRKLLFPGKKYEANGVLGLDSQQLENARGFQHRGDARAVVVRALRGIPGIEMSAEQHHLAGVGAFDVGDNIAFFSGTGERIVNVEADFDIALGEEAAEKGGVFAGDGDYWQRRVRIKTKGGGVHHTVGLVGDDEHGSSARFRQAARDDGARSNVS